MHGDKRQAQRIRTLEQLRNGKLQLIVATDVAARGIDVNGITHVINFDMPKFAEDYVHRIGRTGRAGQDGIAITFVTFNEKRELQKIEQYIGQPIVQSVIEGLEPKAKFSANSDKSKIKRRFGKNDNFAPRASSGRASSGRPASARTESGRAASSRPASDRGFAKKTDFNRDFSDRAYSGRSDANRADAGRKTSERKGFAATGQTSSARGFAGARSADGQNSVGRNKSDKFAQREPYYAAKKTEGTQGRRFDKAPRATETRPVKSSKPKLSIKTRKVASY